MSRQRPESQKAKKPRCPRCSGPMDSVITARNALSRKDNRTYVCSYCGSAEAMLQHAGEDPWPAYPEPMPRRA